MSLSINRTRRTTTLALGIALVSLSAASHAATATISGSPKTWIRAGNAYSFTPTVSGTGTATVSYTVANKPVWASFSKTTGRLYGTPVLANVAKYSNIVISAAYKTYKISLPAFAITVAKPNTAPKISGTPATSIVAGKSYSFRPTAYDAEGQMLTFSIANKPTWAVFSTSTGQVSGIPSTVGNFSGITISVSDGKLSSSLAAFAIAVTKPNTAPVIAGTSVNSMFVGGVYSFKPTASDADGNTLTFSVLNKPSWATFNTSNGTLAGTPTAAGQFANVTISVSDGKATVALAPFTLTVSPVAFGSVTLSWTKPTQNVDGTALTNLAGYKVHYGTDPTHLDQTLMLPGASTTSVSVEELRSGTYYFAVMAYNTNTVESALSEVVWKTIM